MADKFISWRPLRFTYSKKTTITTMVVVCSGHGFWWAFWGCLVICQCSMGPMNTGRAKPHESSWPLSIGREKPRLRDRNCEALPHLWWTWMGTATGPSYFPKAEVVMKVSIFSQELEQFSATAAPRHLQPECHLWLAWKSKLDISSSGPLENVQTKHLKTCNHRWPSPLDLLWLVLAAKCCCRQSGWNQKHGFDANIILSSSLLANIQCWSEWLHRFHLLLALYPSRCCSQWNQELENKMLQKHSIHHSGVW